MENFFSPLNPSELDEKTAILLQTLEAAHKDLVAWTTAADAMIAENDEDDSEEP